MDSIQHNTEIQWMNYGETVHKNYMVSSFTVGPPPWNNNEECGLNKAISYNRMKALGRRWLYFSRLAGTSKALWSECAPLWQMWVTNVAEEPVLCPARENWGGAGEGLRRQRIKCLLTTFCKELCKEAGTSSNKEMSVAGWKGEPGAIKLAVLCSRKLESFMMNYKWKSHWMNCKMIEEYVVSELSLPECRSQLC